MCVDILLTVVRSWERRLAVRGSGSPDSVHVDSHMRCLLFKKTLSNQYIFIRIEMLFISDFNVLILCKYQAHFALNWFSGVIMPCARMRGTNRLQCRQGQQEYCSQVFSCRHDCFHAVWTFLTGSTEEGEDTSFLSSLSSRFDSVFIGRRKKSARSTSSFRYAPTFNFISYCHPKQFYRHPF